MSQQLLLNGWEREILHCCYLRRWRWTSPSWVPPEHRTPRTDTAPPLNSPSFRAAPVTLRRNVSASTSELGQEAAPHRHQAVCEQNQATSVRSKNFSWSLADCKAASGPSCLVAPSTSFSFFGKILHIHLLIHFFCIISTNAPTYIERKYFILKETACYFLSLHKTGLCDLFSPGRFAI